MEGSWKGNMVVAVEKGSTLEKGSFWEDFAAGTNRIC
jgi:hypothetical protein